MREDDSVATILDARALEGQDCPATSPALSLPVRQPKEAELRKEWMEVVGWGVGM